MKKKQTLFLVLVFCKLGLFSQEKSADTARKVIALEEVCIIHAEDAKDKVFSFYRASRLSGTEDILARMPGVNLIKRGAYGLEPGLRNYTGSQTNLTIDGMRMYGACTDKMDPVSIYVEPANLQSIGITQGASGAMAGSTTGGHIDMKMREAGLSCHPVWRGTVAQSYMTVNKGLNSSLSLERSGNRIAFRLSATRRAAENYKAGGDSLIPHSSYLKSNVSGNLLAQINSRNLIKLDALGDWGRNIGYPALPMDVGVANAGILALTHRYTNDSGIVTQNELKVYGNAVYHSMDDTHRENVPMHMDMPGWSRTFGAYNETSLKGDLKFRVDYHQVWAKAEMIMYPKGEARMYLQTLPENQMSDLGFYAQKGLRFRKGQEVQASARIDWYRQFAVDGIGVAQWTIFNEDISQIKTDFLKNLALAYSKQILKNTKVRLSLSFGERIPTSNERYGYYLFNRQDQFDYLGNPELKPEESFQTEFRVDQVYKKLQVYVNLFYHYNPNCIYAYQMTGDGPMTIGARGLKTYTNIAYAVSTGFEAGGQLEIASGWLYLANLKFVYAETFDGKAMPLVPPFKLQEALRYKYKLYQFQLEHDFGAAQNRINPDYADRATPSFNVFNLRASRNISFGKSVLQAGLSCENIFDRLYHEHLDIAQVPRFGRNFTASLVFIF